MNLQTKIAYRQINNSSFSFSSFQHTHYASLRWIDSFAFAFRMSFSFSLFSVCSKLCRWCNWKRARKKTAYKLKLKRIVRNEPLALCSDKRCNYVATFTCWWFSMLFNVRLTFLTYRRCVSFAALDSNCYFFFLCVCVDSRRLERKQKRKYRWVRICMYKCNRGASSPVLNYNKQNRINFADGKLNYSRKNYRTNWIWKLIDRNEIIKIESKSHLTLSVGTRNGSMCISQSEKCHDIPANEIEKKKKDYC